MPRSPRSIVSTVGGGCKKFEVDRQSGTSDTLAELQPGPLTPLLVYFLQSLFDFRSRLSLPMNHD